MTLILPNPPPTARWHCATPHPTQPPPRAAAVAATPTVPLVTIREESASHVSCVVFTPGRCVRAVQPPPYPSSHGRVIIKAGLWLVGRTLFHVSPGRWRGGDPHDPSKRGTLLRVLSCEHPWPRVPVVAYCWLVGHVVSIHKCGERSVDDVRAN